MVRSKATAAATFLVLMMASQVTGQSGFPGYGQRPPLQDVGPLPEDWHPGEFDYQTRKWIGKTARNIKWVARLGSQTFGPPVAADGRVFVGTNNGAGHLSRYPNTTDLGCLLCFRESDGEFLWQYSSEKLPTGRIHDLGLQGIQSTPWIEGDRAWFVDNRGDVICLDTQGFRDGEDDGEPFEESSILSFRKEGLAKAIADLDRQERNDAVERFIADRWTFEPTACRTEVVRAGQTWRIANRMNLAAPSFVVSRDFWGLRVAREKARPDEREADVVWRLNMMERFGSQQHLHTTACVAVWKDALFVCTGNGVDAGHVHIPAPEAPSFVALDKTTGRVLWTSNLPGKNIHHGNWSSPAAGVLGGVPQVVFNGGDGWTYSFHAEEHHDGQPQLLWKFDTNEKNAVLKLGSQGTRNEPIAPPVLHDDRVFITTGQDVEHGEGPGCIWCIDPTKRGDLSAERVVKTDDHNTTIPYDRHRTPQPEKGHTILCNPNSAVIWKYVGRDPRNHRELEFDEQMHRTIAPAVIDGELLFASDFSGVLHCLDVKTGEPHWTYDALAAIWSPPFAADGKVYLVDEDGDVAVFYSHADPHAAGGKPGKPPAETSVAPVREINMRNACYTPPTASKSVLFLANKSYLFAIERKP